MKGYKLQFWRNLIVLDTKTEEMMRNLISKFKLYSVQYIIKCIRDFLVEYYQCILQVKYKQSNSIIEVGKLFCFAQFSSPPPKHHHLNINHVLIPKKMSCNKNMEKLPCVSMIIIEANIKYVCFCLSKKNDKMTL